MYKCFTYFQDVSYLLWREMIDDVQKYNSPTQSSPILANHVSLRWKLAYCQSQSSETVGNLIDGSEKRNRQLRFQFDSSHDSEKRSKTERTQIHFLSDVLVAVASLDLKVLNNFE